MEFVLPRSPSTYLQLSFNSKLTRSFSSDFTKPILFVAAVKEPPALTSGISTRPRRKTGPATRNPSEAEELVALRIKNLTEKKPLSCTLNKYEKMVRTEHCIILFEELGKSGQWLQCLEVFRWMQKQRWYIADSEVYSKLISVMGRQGQTRMAIWLFVEMRNSGCRPDTSVYNALISVHLLSSFRDKTKALDTAIAYFNQMKGVERCIPNIVTYNILLRACSLAQDVDQVNFLFRDLEESIVAPDIFTFNGVMDGYGKNSMIMDMESVLTWMKRSNNRIKPDIITFNLLIDAMTRMGRIKNSKRWNKFSRACCARRRS